MLQQNDTVTLYVTLTREYCVSGDAEEIAEAMRLTLAQLSSVVQDGNDWEPDDATMVRVTTHPLADVQSEEYEVYEITEG